MIKDIVKSLKPSSTLKINEICKSLEKDGKIIYKFGFGQSPFEVPDDVVNELKKNAYKNKYLPMQGLSELRSSISKYYNVKSSINCIAENIIIGLDIEGIAVSAGAACSSGKIGGSHVLRALKYSESDANSAIRVSFGWHNYPEQVDFFLKTLDNTLQGMNFNF